MTLSCDGILLVDSTQPTLLFETHLPTRYYLPREDVRWDQLVPSENRTVCAYKGDAQYWTVPLPGRELREIAWSYPRPLNDGRAVAGMVAFLTEQLDLTLDGTPVDRPVSPW